MENDKEARRETVSDANLKLEAGIISHLLSSLIVTYSFPLTKHSLKIPVFWDVTVCCKVIGYKHFNRLK
jgi:hypothetical protein